MTERKDDSLQKLTHEQKVAALWADVEHEAVEAVYTISERNGLLGQAHIELMGNLFKAFAPMVCKLLADNIEPTPEPEDEKEKADFEDAYLTELELKIKDQANLLNRASGLLVHAGQIGKPFQYTDRCKRLVVEIGLHIPLR